MRDGTGFAQCVISEDRVSADDFEISKRLSQESSIILTGTVIKDERQMGGYELQADSIQVVQIAEEYPISNKEHGVKFLADQRHLWLRSRRQWAILQVRNAIIMAIHDFFQSRGFVQLDSPIFTGNAAEGTTDLFETDFFGHPAFLAQTGQLYGEAMAMAHGLIYTFGPTFRAEKSDTPRHLAEFWMIEPEMAYYDLDMNMDLIEDFIRHIVNQVVERVGTQLEILNRNVESLLKVNKPFTRLSYVEGIEILRGERDVDGRNAIAIQEEDMKKAQSRIEENLKDIAEREALIASGVKKGVRKFNESKILELRKEIAICEEQCRNIPKWIESARNFKSGDDFGGSDETVLTRVFDGPVFIYNWPAPIKAFYMKEVEGNPDYVKGVDLLAPDGHGEIVGGSERENDFSILERKIKEHNLPLEDFKWYLDLRRYGSVPHAGFGLGLERLVRWICDIHHLRENYPFPPTIWTIVSLTLLLCMSVRTLTTRLKQLNAALNVAILSSCLPWLVLFPLKLVTSGESDIVDLIAVLLLFVVAISVVCAAVLIIVRQLYQPKLTVEDISSFELILNSNKTIDEIKHLRDLEFCGNFLVNESDEERVEIQYKEALSLLNKYPEKMKISLEESKSHFLYSRPGLLFDEMMSILDSTS